MGDQEAAPPSPVSWSVALDVTVAFVGLVVDSFDDAAIDTASLPQRHPVLAHTQRIVVKCLT